MRQRLADQSTALPCLLVWVLALLSAGCASQDENEPIPLPGFGDGPAGPRGVYAVIRRVDVPLNEPTDAAWSLINEQVVPPLTRGAWRGNGLRVGLLRRDQLDPYAQAMPQPVAFGESVINKSDYPVPILETAQLRNNLRFEIDLTRPPRPRQVGVIQGGKRSTLRMLAQIKTDDEGRHRLVLTPHHFIPSRFDLVPRNPLEKELDGRVFEELAIELTPGEDQIIVIGLYWPWPGLELPEAPEPAEVQPDDEPTEEEPEIEPAPEEAGNQIEPPAIEPNDPAAPPPHITRGRPDTRPGDSEDTREEQAEAVIAPPLPTHFGSTLFTGTRIRQQVRSVLLITIENPPGESPAEPRDE